MKEGYIKKEERKKILLLTDDIRVHSGVATVGREIVTNTAHRYNWVQLAGAIKHPEKEKIVDLSKATGEKISSADVPNCVAQGDCEGYKCGYAAGVRNAERRIK